MRIKRIEIIGFKSFVDRTVLNIDEPITGVVGPNGCGKSNVVDAIRWCMGEQSAKHLRGKAMEDVIFQGSDSRDPANMAEVSLTFENVGFRAHHVTQPDEQILQDGAEPVSEDAESVASEAVASESVASEAVASEAVASEAVASESDASEAVASEAVASEAVASEAVASEAVASEAVASEAVASESVASEAVASEAAAVDTEPEVHAGDEELAKGIKAAESAQKILDEEPILDLSQYGEITITRRLFRDGTSGYFINKTPCRLRDVTDFFLGTGVGTKAYSIIEQGRVGMIVSAKPGDRRTIIEEAAGITKFKKKKVAAERKMDQTRQNLLRVTDVVAEIEKQLGSLRRQAQKAERYKRYKSEMRDIDLWSASHRFLEFEAQAKVLEEAYVEAQREKDDFGIRLNTKEAGISAERAENALEEKRLTDLTETVYDLENRIKLTESQIDFQGREARELADRAVSAEGELHGMRVQVLEDESELAQSREKLVELGTRLEACNGEAERLKEARQVARADLEEAQEDLESFRHRLLSAQTEIARDENNQQSLDRRRSELESRLERLVEEEAELTPRHLELKKEIDKLDKELGSLRQTKLDLGERQETFAARLDELKQLCEDSSLEVEELRSELQRRKSRLQSLGEIQERYEGFAKGTRAVMQHRPGDNDEKEKIRGLVADLVQAPAEYENCVEAILGDRIGSIVVQSQEVGLAGVSFLKEKSEGRSAFIPMQPHRLPNRQALSQSGSLSDGCEDMLASEGVQGRLVDFVHCPKGYELLSQHLFEDVFVVESLSRALELWQSGIKKTLVTLEGDILDRHGVVSGGAREGASGVLAQKREIRELEELCAQLEQQVADATARNVGYQTERKHVESTLDEIRREKHEGEISMLAMEKDLTRFQSDAARSQERKVRLDSELSEIRESLDDTMREEGETSQRLVQARTTLDASESEKERLSEIVKVRREALESADEELTESQVILAQVRAEGGNLESQVQRLSSHVEDLQGRIERMERSADESSKRSSDLASDSEGKQSQLEALRLNRQEKNLELEKGRSAYDKRVGALQEAEAEIRILRQGVESHSKRVNELEISLHDVKSKAVHLEESIEERYRECLRHTLIDFHLRPPVSNEEEKRLKELRELIHRMGEINLTAIDEYETLSSRYEFLTSQREDLENALDQLEKAISKINKTSRKLFRETYEAVNRKFQEIFPRLFRGGRAELRLSGGETDVLDAGIDIFAQPPGKKNGTVELMSGGEKALTAVSLIFSIFLIKPSPFCILDEVDAPLDDANVDRYNELVREMTDTSQFIVITHNKRTMEIADQLYGVTMEEPGCSKLVSVNMRVYEGGRVAA